MKMKNIGPRGKKAHPKNYYADPPLQMDISSGEYSGVENWKNMGLASPRWPALNT